MLLGRPFDDPAYFFEPKYDGFRGMLYLTRPECHFRSKRGNILKQFDALCTQVRQRLSVDDAILDGEVIGSDVEGRQDFAHSWRGGVTSTTRPSTCSGSIEGPSDAAALP